MQNGSWIGYWVRAELERRVGKRKEEKRKEENGRGKRRSAMFPEEFKSTLMGLVDADDDMKTLLGLFYILKGYTTDETLKTNFAAFTGKDCTELLHVLRKRGILKLGTYNEYLCLSGYEKFFDEIARSYVPQQGNLVAYLQRAMEHGDEATVKMLELLLKIGKLDSSGFTQHELIKNDMAELYSPETFQAIEADLIKEQLCLYGKKQATEFLELYQGEDNLQTARELIRAWRRERLTALPVRETLEQMSEELIAKARRGISEWGSELAERAGISEQELEATTGHFSGFSVDGATLMLGCTIIVEHDTLHVALTDSLSRHDAREWRYFPALIIAERVPKWIDRIELVFRYAYPKLSERRMAIAVPGEVAYANFKQALLFELLEQLGITEVREFTK
jgi:hypothetical protein